jgi:hypothetical protein
MPEPSPPRSTKLSLAATALALAAGLVFLIALAQHESGRYFFKTVSLDAEIAKSRPVSGIASKVNLPKPYRGVQNVVEQALVLEDGIPLPLRIEKIKYVTESGHGRYRITSRAIYLSAPDDSDPRSNGRSYELLVPRQVRPAVLWGALVLLAVAMFCLQRWGVPRIPDFGGHRWLEPLLVMSVSLAAMFWSLEHFSERSDGWLIVKGVPYSDGIGWLELAKSLSEGRGFSGAFEAHRGGYPILLGGFFSLAGGASIVLAKLFNVLMLALGATAAYLFARAAFGRAVALVLLVGLLLGTRFEHLVEMTITEPTGFALAVIGLHQLYRACLNPAFWRFLVVGIFLGLSNLVRPFTLLALPLFGALILWVAWRGRWGPRRFGLVAVAYVGGALLVFAPWVQRQKQTWGVATLDLNSSVMLYGAAAPALGDERRALSARHYAEGDEAGIPRQDRGARYSYYMGRYKEVVADDPGGYSRFVAEQFFEFFTVPGFGDGHVREEFGAIFFFCVVWLAWRRRAPGMVLLAGLWPLIAPGMEALPAALVVAIGAGVGFACHRGPARVAIAVLVATLVGAGLLNALVGNFALDRGSVFIEWIVFLLVASGMAGVARLAAGVGSEDSGFAAAGERFSDVYPLVLLTLFAAGSGLLVAKAAFADKPDLASWEVPDPVADRARAEVARREPAAGDGALYVSRVRLGEYRWFISKGEDVGHWARPFEVREFDRTVALPLTGYDPKSLGGRAVTINIPGDERALDGERDFLLVGLSNVDDDAPLDHGTLVVETLALIPYDAAAAELDLRGGTYFPLPPDLPPLTD